MVRGRKPNSTDVNRASGAFEKNPSRENKHAPEAKKGYPEKPTHILENELTSKYWDDVCYQMDEMKILAESDGPVIEMFVEAMAVKQRLFLDGNVAALHKQGELCLRMATELGLTPSARTRLAVKDVEVEDAFSQWMAGSGASDN
jgi:phage terminase small subunit